MLQSTLPKWVETLTPLLDHYEIKPASIHSTQMGRDDLIADDWEVLRDASIHSTQMGRDRMTTRKC